MAVVVVIIIIAIVAVVLLIFDRLTGTVTVVLVGLVFVI